MKFLTITFFIISILKLINCNYVKIEIFQGNDYKCSNEVTITQYRVSGICDPNGFYEFSCESGSSNKVDITHYNNVNCSGASGTQSINSGSCSVNPVNSDNVKYSCSEDYEIGSNSIVSYLTSGSCPDSNPDWKNDVIQVGYTTMNTCIGTSIGSTKTVDCNETTFTEELFITKNSCGSPIWTAHVPFAQCDEYGSSNVMVCNK